MLGCGNVLFGDDGFGPAVVAWLDAHCRDELAERACVLDAGTGVRSILFTLALSGPKPARIVVVDAVDAGRAPGELFTLPVDGLPPCKTDDFSMHQLPTSNLLKELQEESGVDVTLLCGQVARIPDRVAPGLSASLREAVPRAARMVLARVREP